MELIRIKKPKLSIDLAPLIDIVFQLLIFFMLTSTFASPAIKMVLPQAKTVDKLLHKNIVVSIDQKGTIFINDRVTDIESFQKRLTQVLKETDQKAIHFKGDKDMPYSLFVQVIDLAKQSGAQQINIVHKKAGNP